MKVALVLLALLLVLSAALARPAEDGALARQRRGSVTGDVHREDGVGTVAKVEGEGTVWKSRNGKTRIDAHGAWGKVLSGPGRGKPSFGGGFKISF